MKITAARFLGAAAAPGGGPPAREPEIAFAGRSNVGKSSLLNALLGRRGLARVSRTPGRTRQINFFLANERFVIADLPGYGFAMGSEAERASWGPLVESYLRDRPTLRGVAILTDVRRGLEPDEEAVLAFLAEVAVPAAVVATKVDKLGRGEALAAVRALAQRLGDTVPALAVSARTGEGLEALWRVLRGWLASEPRWPDAGREGKGRRLLRP